MTMIEELAQFLGRLLFLRETNRLTEAVVEIDDFCTRFLGHTGAELRAMSYDEMMAICSENGELEVNRAVALGAMMKELGDVAALEEKREDACNCHTRSLLLLLTAYGDGTIALPLEVPERIDLVIERVGGCDLPTALLAPLFRYFEQRGFYADAENLLFEMIEAGLADAVRDGIAFYERLLTKEDTDLANGDLPREEVEEGLEALRGKGGDEG